MSRERGSIAIVALWGVALIAVLLAAASAATRSEVFVAGNALGSARARLAAEAGTQLGLARLLRGERDPQTWQDGGTAVRIAIVDEAGKIDINLAPLDLLAGLFTAAGNRTMSRSGSPATSSTAAAIRHRLARNRISAGPIDSPRSRSWPECRASTRRSTSASPIA